MKIAQIHWAFPPIIGGVESHLAILGPELIKNDCQVSLLTGAVEGLPEEDWYQGMYIKRTPLMDLNSLNSQIIAQKAGQIRQVIAEFIDYVKPDIIHVHNMHYFSPVHADILNEIKTARNLSLILTSHNVWQDEDEMWQEMNKRAQIWDAVISVSHYIKKEMVRVGYDEETNFVVHHGIDLNRFNPLNEQDKAKIAAQYPEFAGRRVFFHPARMSLDKGCHISVKALDIIRREFPEALLIMAGTGQTVDWGSHQQKHITQIMGMIEERGLKDNVYVRFFAWDEMPLVYKAAEFCLYPSCFEEPFGLTMLESQATEKPIIVSRAGGMPEIIRDGVNGYVVEMANEEELADRCLRLLRDPKLCQTMGKQGRALLEKLWTKETMTTATLEVYKDVLLRKNRMVQQILA